MPNEMKVAVATGLLAFVGAITGNYVVSHLEQERADRQFKQQYRVHLLDKRIAIIEACTHARFQLHRALELKGYQDAMVTFRNSDKSANVAFQREGPPEKLLEIQREMVGITSEYTGCLQNGNTMFGPKTLKAAGALEQAEAYDPEDPKLTPLFQAFFNAMAEEATYCGEKKSH